MIGTTHFINALVQRKRDLRPVAVLRLCSHASAALPPFVDFPEDVREIIEGIMQLVRPSTPCRTPLAASTPSPFMRAQSRAGDTHLVAGGFEYTGQPLGNIDREEIVTACRAAKAKGIGSFAGAILLHRVAPRAFPLLLSHSALVCFILWLIPLQ